MSEQDNCKKFKSKNDSKWKDVSMLSHTYFLSITCKNKMRNTKKHEQK